MILFEVLQAIGLKRAVLDVAGGEAGHVVAGNTVQAPAQTHHWRLDPNLWVIWVAVCSQDARVCRIVKNPGDTGAVLDKLQGSWSFQTAGIESWEKLLPCGEVSRKGNELFL